MSERFCPFCGRANRSDLPRCMNCGQRMMPAVPTTDNATGTRSVLLTQDEDETQTVVARTGNHEPWWRTVEGSPFGSIPPPPQIKEEMERFQAREDAKAAALRAEEAAKEAALAHERKKAAAAAARAAAAEKRTQAAETVSAPSPPPPSVRAKPAATSTALLECLRCGTAPPPGGGFSFCLSCGGDLTGGTSTKTTFASASASVRASAASAASHSVAAPGASTGVRLHEAKAVKNAGIVSISSVTTTTTTTHANTFPPGVAALLSFFVPGVGQIVNGQIAKGVVLLLASFFVTAVLFIPTMGLFPLLGRVVAALDAYRIAEKRRKGKTVRPDEWDF